MENNPDDEPNLTPAQVDRYNKQNRGLQKLAHDELAEAAEAAARYTNPELQESYASAEQEAQIIDTESQEFYEKHQGTIVGLAEKENEARDRITRLEAQLEALYAEPLDEGDVEWLSEREQRERSLLDDIARAKKDLENLDSTDDKPATSYRGGWLDGGGGPSSTTDSEE